MELIELSTTTQRALELLAVNGTSAKSLHGHTHTGFGSILRYFHHKGILYVTGEMLDAFLLEQRVLLDQGDISQWKWGLVHGSSVLQQILLICLTFAHGTLYGTAQSKSSNAIGQRQNSLQNLEIFMCLSGWSTNI